MKNCLYVLLLEKTKSYKRINKEVIKSHVDYIRELDENGKLFLCGPLQGWPGVAGMYILRVDSMEEAKKIAQAEPLVNGGYTTYKLSTLVVANKDNDYLL